MNKRNNLVFIVSIFNRIMSVNSDRKYQPVQQIINSTQNYLHYELRKYATYLQQAQNQIRNTINMHFFRMNKQQQTYKCTISELQSQIMQLKEDNSFLRNQYMLKSIQQEQIKKSNIRILKENAQKEERVRVLAEEVQTIKKTLNNFQPRDIVDFDEGEETPFHFDKSQGLQTIKEVSEHDFSVTMSVQSLQSELIEDNPKEIQSGKDTDFSQQSLGAENYQIENYQDALHFLKSYNKGRGSKITKKSAEIEVPLSSQRLWVQDPNKNVQKIGNQTINKIKKMRKIEDKKPMNSNQQNMCLSVNQITSQDHIPITQSKLEYVDSPQQYEDKTKSSTSINSNKFASRVKENIVNLEDPIKNVVQLLQHINAANMHAIKRQALKGQFHKISYVGGLSFLGNCNQFNQPCGFGKLLLNKEVIYQGQWRLGKFHGWGKLVLLSFVKQRQKSIIEIDGHFKNGMVQGSVICTFNSGERFMGLIKNQSIEKEGTFVSEKGIMTGFWENNRLIYLI